MHTPACLLGTVLADYGSPESRKGSVIMFWQATVRIGPGMMVCGTAGHTETDAMRNLARVLPAGRAEIISLVVIPPRNER